MMTYQINSVSIDPPPTSASWQPRQAIGVDGLGRAIYSPVRAFTLNWDALTPTQFNALQSFFEAGQTAGTVQASIPTYGSATYGFTVYTVVIDEPVYREYYQQHYLGVTMNFREIVTT